MSSLAVKTPCVGLCSTVYGDLVCRGCKRVCHEIIDWNGYPNERRLAIWQRLEQLQVQVLASKLLIVDSQRLREQLEARQIRFVAEQSPYCWAYQLLRRGAGRMRNLQAYGLALQPAFAGMPLAELLEQVEQAYFQVHRAFPGKAALIFRKKYSESRNP